MPEVMFTDNYDWMKGQDVVGFLGKIGRHFRLNTMLAKDAVSTRLNSTAVWPYDSVFTYVLIGPVLYTSVCSVQEEYREHNQ